MLTLIYINSSNCSLEHSHFNPEYSVSAEAPRQESKNTAPEQRDMQLETLKTLFFNLVAARNIKKALKTAAAFIIAAEKYINALKYCINNITINNNNKKINNRNIIKII